LIIFQAAAAPLSNSESYLPYEEDTITDRGGDNCTDMNIVAAETGYVFEG